MFALFRSVNRNKVFLVSFMKMEFNTPNVICAKKWLVLVKLVNKI